jgi:hypothetical protein
MFGVLLKPKVTFNIFGVAKNEYDVIQAFQKLWTSAGEM